MCPDQMPMYEIDGSLTGLPVPPDDTPAVAIAYLLTDKPLWHAVRERIEENVDVFLELLDEAGARATFFFLGRIAEDLPHVVWRVAEQGHEIASHNYHHRRITDLRPDEFREIVRRSKEALEEASSSPALGFRAPDFSITDESLWALDVLRESGFAYDSSIYPIRGHDVYGVPGATRNLHRHHNSLVEFPMACLDLSGVRIPFGGGGYFRLYPLWVTFAMANRVNRSGEPCMFYIHPYEVGPNIPDIAEMSGLRRFRHYYHCNDGRQRMRELLSRFRRAPAAEILRHLGWLQMED
jgi:polysaccharide deacetylase family protein (PEP-CTERM system associated)